MRSLNPTDKRSALGGLMPAALFCWVFSGMGAISAPVGTE